MNFKKIGSGILASLLAVSCSFLNVSALEISNSANGNIMSETMDTTDLQLLLDEINAYLNNNPSMTVLIEPGSEKSVAIPLSNGTSATFSIKSQRISKERKSEVWTDFDYGDYVFTYTITLPLYGKIIHTVDYTLEEFDGELVKIDFTDTDISATPIQGTTISHEGASIISDEIAPDFVGRAEGHVTFDLLDYNVTVYTNIVMSSFYSSKEEIRKIKVEYNYHI